MANKERNKRSARKARSEERARVEAAQATAESGSQSVKKAEAKSSKPVQAKRKGRIAQYLSDVRTELHRVIWPSRPELKSYSLAVIATLAVFGVIIWLVDTGIVAVLVGLTGLRG